MNEKEKTRRELIAIGSKYETDTTVTVGIATQKGRTRPLKVVLESLLKQDCKVHVYFNEFKGKIPKSIKDIGKQFPGKLTMFESEKEAGDLGSYGGFYKIGEITGIFASCDDDIIYPDNYIETIKEAIKEYDNQFIIAYHGRIFTPDKPIFAYYTGAEKVFDFARDQKKDVLINVVGAGVCAFNNDIVQLTIDAFTHKHAKDISLSIFAQNNEIPIVCKAHRAGFLRNQMNFNRATSILNTSLQNDQYRVDLMNSIQWQIINPTKKLIIDTAIENAKPEQGKPERDRDETVYVRGYGGAPMISRYRNVKNKLERGTYAEITKKQYEIELKAFNANRKPN